MSESKTYNWNEEFQRKLLALCVRDPKSIRHIVEPQYFTNPIHLDIARLSSEIYKEHRHGDTRLGKGSLSAIVKGYLGKKRHDVWPAYKKVIKKLFKDKLKDRPVILQQAIQFAKEQRFRAALIDAERYVNAKNYTAAMRQFERLKTFGKETDLGVGFWKDSDDADRWSEDRRGLVRTFFFPTLDNYMGGGLGAGELAIILAGGKVGKTTMLARIAAGAMWLGKTAAVATGELSDKKYRKRIDTMITGLSSWTLTHLAGLSGGDHTSRKEKKRLKKALRRMKQARKEMKGDLWIKQFPTNKGKVEDIEAWLDNLADAGIKVDVLLVDYLRVFKPNERYDGQTEKLGLVASDLRGLAVERQIPVWTASQARRAALSKAKLGPEDIAEDISIFFTLDFLIALCQTEEEAGTHEDREKGKPEKARLFLTAGRDVGRGGMIDISIQRDTSVVKEKEKSK
jgi:DnaB-like helicase C terminal domain